MISKFKENLKGSLGFTKRVNPDINYLEKLIDTFDKTATIFNTHAPVQSTLITDRKPNPFKTADVNKSKTEKKKAQKKWRKTRNVDDYNDLRIKRNHNNRKLNLLRSQALSHKIDKNKGNSKVIYKIINAALHCKLQSPLPETNNKHELAESFNKFFKEKLNNLGYPWMELAHISQNQWLIITNLKPPICQTSKKLTLKE